ncbi:MAG TPA: hypothetical protein VJY62_03930 [Bacteroidia bacterium]|nr:hypothetical protein [Bacteroidia bacterium]
MKTKKYLQIAFSSLILFVLALSACKKDRVVQDDYQSMDSFYNQYKEEEQEYVIDSSGSCPLVCKKGTKLCASADLLQFSGGTGVTYPFTLKVVELYSIKEMLLWRAPATAGGGILETSAEIRVRPFKNGTEVELKPNKTYYMEMDTMPNLQSSMQMFYGHDSNGIIDWSNSGSSVSVNSYFYILNVGETGWVSSARPHTSTAQNTTITITAAGTNTQNIEIYLTFANFKGLMKITNLVSGSVPIGEQVKLFAMAKNQNNDYVLDQQTFTVTGNQQITLNMQVVSEASLLAALDAL